MEAPVAARRTEAGFSIIEGLIAAALLAIVAVGILPLFARAMANNVKGNDSTRQSNGAIDEFERTIAMPYDSGYTTLIAGDERVEQTVIALKDMPGSSPGAMSFRWEPRAALAAGDLVQTVRERRARQFPWSDFVPTDPAISLDEPAPVGTNSSAVHLRVFDLDIFDEQKDPLRLAQTNYRMRLITGY